MQRWIAALTGFDVCLLCEDSSNFGKPPFSLDCHITSIPVSVAQSSVERQDYDLVVLGVPFVQLLKRYEKTRPDDKGRVYVDLNAPMSIDDFSSAPKDTTAKSSIAMRKLIEVQKAREQSRADELIPATATTPAAAVQAPSSINAFEEEKASCETLISVRGVLNTGQAE